MTVLVVDKAEDIPTKPIDGKPTLVYWNIVGLALPIRLALVYTSHVDDFVDVRIDAGDPSDKENFMKAWRQAKHGPLEEVMHFPNLPYLLDPKNDVAVSQTNTILRHIGRTYHLPHTSGREHMTDLVCDQLTDLEATLVRLVYGKGPDFVLGWYRKEVPAILSKFSKILQGTTEAETATATATTFLTGTEPTIDDFKFYSFLHKLTIIQESLGNEETASIITQDMRDYMKEIEDLPNIKEYLNGPDHLARPMNNPMAKWIGEWK